MIRHHLLFAYGMRRTASGDVVGNDEWIAIRASAAEQGRPLHWVPIPTVC